MDKLTLTSLPDNVTLLFSHFQRLLDLIRNKIQGPTMAAGALDASGPSSPALISFPAILRFITALALTDLPFLPHTWPCVGTCVAVLSQHRTSQFLVSTH